LIPSGKEKSKGESSEGKKRTILGVEKPGREGRTAAPLTPPRGGRALKTHKENGIKKKYEPSPKTTISRDRVETSFPKKARFSLTRLFWGSYPKEFFIKSEQKGEASERKQTTEVFGKAGGREDMEDQFTRELKKKKDPREKEGGRKGRFLYFLDPVGGRVPGLARVAGLRRHERKL